MILVDTNVLTRMSDAEHPHYAAARRSLLPSTAALGPLVIVPQNLYEFWAVATRNPGTGLSGQNGLGMSTTRADLGARFFQRRFQLLPDQVDLLATWLALVSSTGTTGVKSHDARLVAAMQTYGIRNVLTFNAADFRRFDVEVIDPASL